MRGEFKVRAQRGADRARLRHDLAMGHWHQYIATSRADRQQLPEGIRRVRTLGPSCSCYSRLAGPVVVSEEKGYICDAMEVYVQDTDPFFKHRSKKRKKNWVEVCNS
jgi:hypothetical protein